MDVFPKNHFLQYFCCFLFIWGFLCLFLYLFLFFLLFFLNFGFFLYSWFCMSGFFYFQGEGGDSIPYIRNIILTPSRFLIHTFTSFFLGIPNETITTNLSPFPKKIKVLNAGLVLSTNKFILLAHSFNYHYKVTANKNLKKDWSK